MVDVKRARAVLKRLCGAPAFGGVEREVCQAIFRRVDLMQRWRDGDLSVVKDAAIYVGAVKVKVAKGETIMATVSTSSAVTKTAPDRTFEQFVAEFRELLDHVASRKGYNDTGVEGKNVMFDFIKANFGMGHALGEIVYKATRYSKRGDRTDLLKIAAWAYLIWRNAPDDF